MKPGKKNLITDITGIKIGNAEDHSIKTGVTVLTSDNPFTAGISVMGGAPGTRETDLLAPDKMVQEIDAIVLSGGSAFGLDSASGVADELAQQGRGFKAGDANVPIVPAAIIFDLLNGGNKNWDINPYKNLGKTALENCDHDFKIGSFGAGTGATTANLKGGLGSASLILDNGITVGAIVAVNSFGAVSNGKGEPFFASPFEISKEFGGIEGQVKHDPSILHLKLSSRNRENTTIAIVATDAKLTKAQATRLATVSHDGMARAIIPAHTPVDGDLVFAASIGNKKLVNPVEDELIIGHAASVCLARAIARGVYFATPKLKDTKPTFKDH